jgi:hypothetical protein
MDKEAQFLRPIGDKQSLFFSSIVRDNKFNEITVPIERITQDGMLLKNPLLSTSTREIMTYVKKEMSDAGTKNPSNKSFSS